MKGKCILTVLLLFINSSIVFGQKALTSNSYKYLLSVPDSLNETTEAGNDSERTFYDNTSGIVMMITIKEGIFANTSGYMNCSKKDLERELKDYQGDSTLKLISCSQSKYYSNEAVALHFETNILPEGFTRCMIYFIHHKNKEVQFSFMYDKENETHSISYIEKVMQTLKLP